MIGCATALPVEVACGRTVFVACSASAVTVLAQLAATCSRPLLGAT
jgi:hypothetical protein